MSVISVEFFDTTLRDGAQALPAAHQFETGTKPDIARHLAELGIGVIEAGFPATPSDGEEVAEVAKTVGNERFMVRTWSQHGEGNMELRSPVIAGLSRTLPADIEATWAAVQHAARPRIHTFISTDPEHMAAKFPDKTPEQVLMMGVGAVEFAKKITAGNPQATVEFSAEAASTTDEKYLEWVIKSAIDAGADIINVPDTVGQRSPSWMRSFYGKVIRWVTETNPDVAISSHNHNDLGLAVANTLELVSAAHYARTPNTVRLQMETTVCGLGERAGNADIFPVVAGLFKFTPELDGRVGWSFNPQESVHVAQAVMGFAGLSVDRQNPVVGSDIMAHRSGIHSDGVIKGGHRIYTPFDPTFWGHTSNAVHEEGKYQGRRGAAAAQEAAVNA